MPVTFQKRIWVEGRRNLSHLGKNNNYLFPNLQHTQFKHVQLL